MAAELMFVGVGKCSLYLPSSHSLKDKRRILQRMKDRMHNMFKVPLAEVDGLDNWQHAGLGFAVVGNEHIVVEGLMTKMFNALEGFGEVHITDIDQEIIPVGSVLHRRERHIP